MGTLLALLALSSRRPRSANNASNVPEQPGLTRGRGFPSVRRMPFDFAPGRKTAFVHPRSGVLIQFWQMPVAGWAQAPQAAP